MMRRGALLLLGLCLLISACGSPSAPPCRDTDEGVGASCPAPEPTPTTGKEPAPIPGQEPAPNPVKEPAPEPPAVIVDPSESVTRRFRLIEPAALLAGGPALLEGSLSLPRTAAFSISPDHRQALVFTGDPFLPSMAPYLVDLATGERTEIVGAPDDPLFCWGGWGPDGSPLLLDFDTLWRVEDGQLVRWTDFAERGCRLTERSQDGRYLASWSPLRLIDLQTGATVTVAERFDPIAQDGGVSISWAPEGDQIAVGHAFQSGIMGGPLETVVVDLEGRIVRRIPHWWPTAWLPDGDLVVMRPAWPERPTMARLTREGAPSPRSAPWEGEYSPDGRWVFTYASRERHFIEVESRRMGVIPDGFNAQWLWDSTLLLTSQ